MKLYRLHSNYETPPEGAERITYTHVETRAAADPADIPFYKGDTAWWYGEGTNHRTGVQTIGGAPCIRRDIEASVWVSEIADLASLDDLKRYIDENDGRVLLHYDERVPGRLFVTPSAECYS